MIFKVIKETFSVWWSKLGYTFLGSILAALNPFFILTIMSLFGVLLGNLSKVIASPIEYLLPASVMIAMQIVFPTTFIATVMQKRVIESEIIYFRDYFKLYLKSWQEYIVPSILVTLMYGIISYFLVNSAIFYHHMPMNQSIKTAILTIIVILYGYFMMVQYIMVPILIYRKGIKIFHAFRIAMGVTVLNFFPIFGIMIFDGIIFILFTFLGASTIIIYFSVSPYLRFFLYKKILEKYIPKNAKGSNKESIENAWAQIMKWKNLSNEELKEKR